MSSAARGTYLGYREADRSTPFARFFRPEMAPLSPAAVDALHHGTIAPPLLRPLDEAAAMLTEESATEYGYAVCPDRSIRVAVRTLMPGVTPAMWDWWFGWHGCEARRYKLWHPRAHLDAAWADGADGDRRGRERYVGRTSLVDEYIGSELLYGAIRFVRPDEVGFDESLLTDQTAICARVGAGDQPIDIGWLVHHVRPIDGGCEMRSRFWMGGPHIAVRPGVNAVARLALPRVAARRYRPDARTAQELYVHCAQEMAHLASFLSELHAEFGQD